MVEIQEDPTRDALVDTLVEELSAFILHVHVYGIEDIQMRDFCRQSLKERIKEILDHERDRIKV